MTYHQAIDWLYDLRLLGSKLGLDKPRRLAALAGNPQERLKIIHVAGTNGKGSVCAMLESIYRVAGYKTGLFTSPHLVSFRERIQVNRTLISEEDVVRQVGKMQMRLQELSAADTPTFFEVITIMTFEYFEECDCDIVLLETGLGGRLDATNIVHPIASVITPISLDHQLYLGETIEEITGEKAGIIKPGIPVFCANQQTSVTEVIEQVAQERGASLSLVGKDETDTALSGRHQRENATLAKVVVENMESSFSSETILRGLEEVQWQGRLECVKKGHQKYVIDTAHNPAGVQALVDYLREEFQGARPALLIGMLADKNWGDVIELLSPLMNRIVCVPVGSERGLAPRQLAAFASQHCESVQSCDSLTEGFDEVSNEPLVVAAGSAYLIGEVLDHVGLIRSTHEHGLNDWHITKSDMA